MEPGADMSYSGLLDHTARIWRRDETLGTYRETVMSYTVQYHGPPCTLRRKRSVLSEAGPGIVDSGERTVYFKRDILLQKRDLVELVTGPDAPAWLEVESASRPRGHHTEARCSEWSGDTPELES
jgi:hypothetical protein